LRTITTPMPATADPSSAPQPTATYINGLDPDEVTRFAEMGLLLDRHKSPPLANSSRRRCRRRWFVMQPSGMASQGRRSSTSCPPGTLVARCSTNELGPVGRKGHRTTMTRASWLVALRTDSGLKALQGP
jgi:hypothetical protein